MDQPVALTIGEEIGRYGFPDGHPFGPYRMNAFWREATRQGLHQRVTVRKPVLAERADIELFHDPSYVDLVERSSKNGYGLLDHGDTPAYAGVYEAASHVVGSTLDLLDQIMAGHVQRAFIPIAGLHHARRNRAGGFCVFNDCGIVIEVLRARYGIQRVAYIDIDAHHGDGVFYSFEEDPEVIFADLHEDGRYLYPGTGREDEIGKGEAAGRKLNIPMPPGADDDAFHQEWPRVEAHLRAFQPQFILMQCGCDSVAGDPLTHMQYSPTIHGQAARSLTLLAQEFGHGRILATGGGGYNPTNIGLAWSSVVQALLETP